MAKAKVTIKALRTESPWAIAERLGIHYTGDMSPIPHCGTWYNTHEWHHGYSECVRITESNGTLWLESGTINRPSNPSKLASALRCCGWDIDDDGNYSQSGHSVTDQPTKTLIEIESCLAYSGCEVDLPITIEANHDGDYPEFRIFQQVAPMLLAILPPIEQSYLVRYAPTGETIGEYSARSPLAACRKAWRDHYEYADRKGELYAVPR